MPDYISNEHVLLSRIASCDKLDYDTMIGLAVSLDDIIHLYPTRAETINRTLIALIEKGLVVQKGLSYWTFWKITCEGLEHLAKLAARDGHTNFTNSISSCN